MMRAAVLNEFGAPLELAQLPEPKPQADELLIRVRATGLCGTDLKVVSGALPSVRPPVVLGHEVAGEIVEDPLGEFSAGQHVACYLYESCGHCPHCRAGRVTLCPSVVRIGIERNGGLAEYMAVARENVLPIDTNVPFEAAAVSMDSVLTPWHGLIDRGEVSDGDKVMVVGAGGLGLNGVQIARHLGAAVAVVEPNPRNRDCALELGAALAVQPSEASAVREWAGDGVDVALDTSGVASGFDVAFAGLRPAGRLVACGYQPGVPFQLESSRLPLAELTILGVRAGSRADARAALEAVASGAVVPVVSEVVGLDQANGALERLARGGVLGRLAVDPTG
jgi:D-arabinose 1-dehydrogenase-like Zn-dependent alcohol dehydrogenase